MEKKRDPYFDNAKFILMVLVVFGHFLQPFIHQHYVYTDIYYFIYIFHMPAFVVISGYFAKNYQQKKIKDQVLKLLVPYVLLQWFYSAYYSLIGLHKSFSFDLFTPQWSLWFLVSMFCWQMLLHLFGRLSAIWSLGISIGLSLLVGYISFVGRPLGLQRTFVFFPFFLLGYYLSQKDVRRLQTAKKSRALITLSLIYGFVYLGDVMNKYWVFGSKPYEDYLALPELGGAVRLLIFCIGVVAVFSFLVFVPTKETFYTQWGKNTLTAYLTQGIFVKGLRVLPIENWKLNFLGFVFLCIFSFGLTVFLSSNRLKKIGERLKLQLINFWDCVRKSTSKNP